jgi:rod shape-determining protein MreC
VGPKKKRSSPLPLVLVSGLLLLLPSALTQKTRLLATAGFLPFQGVGRWAARLPERALPSTAESQQLATEVAFLKDQNQKQANEIKRLSAQLDMALGMKQPVRDQNHRLIVADVVFPTDSSPWRKSLTIALGSGDGVEKGMLVLYNNQVVGRVSETAPKTSRVQIVTDPGFRAGAVAAPKNYGAGVALSERNAGVYEGTAGANGQLKWFGGETPVENHSFVVTTEDPLNGVPRGLILGRVVTVNHGRGAFPKVEVEPLLNFRALEHVMLLVPPAVANPIGAKAGGR